MTKNDVIWMQIIQIIKKIKSVGVFSPAVIQNCSIDEISNLYKIDKDHIDKWFSLNFNL